MPHTLAHVRVQWVANPLSGHVYFVLFTRVDQVRDPALHRIELKTARSTAQRLRPPTYGGRDDSRQFTIFIVHSLTLPACPLRSAARAFTVKEIKINSKNKFHGVLLIWWCFCSVVESLAPTLRNEQHNITPSTHPYKYIELLKPCPVPFGTVCGIMREKFFEAEGEKQISPA